MNAAKPFDMDRDAASAYGSLEPSLFLPKVTISGGAPTIGGRIHDFWHGHYRGDPVVVKLRRISTTDDLEVIKKVSSKASVTEATGQLYRRNFVAMSCSGEIFNMQIFFHFWVLQSQKSTSHLVLFPH